MAFKYPIETGLQISLDGILWHKLTDHNRSPISQEVEVIEKSARMANGTMRKYVIATKNSFSASWDMLPSKTDLTVDGGFSSEWMDAFYSANAFLPIYLKVVSAGENIPETGHYPNESSRLSSDLASQIYTVFITSFSKTIVKRSAITDYVEMQIQFTEI